MTSRAKRHLLPSDCSDLANISAIREQSASHNHVEQPKTRTQRTRVKYVKYASGVYKSAFLKLTFSNILWNSIVQYVNSIILYLKHEHHNQKMTYLYTFKSLFLSVVTVKASIKTSNYYLLHMRGMHVLLHMHATTPDLVLTTGIKITFSPCWDTISAKNETLHMWYTSYVTLLVSQECVACESGKFFGGGNYLPVLLTLHLFRETVPHNKPAARQQHTAASQLHYALVHNRMIAVLHDICNHIIV